MGSSDASASFSTFDELGSKILLFSVRLPFYFTNTDGHSDARHYI